jgi:hypothetical protein
VALVVNSLAGRDGVQMRWPTPIEKFRTLPIVQATVTVSDTRRLCDAVQPIAQVNDALRVVGVPDALVHHDGNRTRLLYANLL